MRILFISTKQPSVNPRLRKAAQALTQDGNTVHILYAYSTEWAMEADEKLFQEVNWTQEMIGGNPINQSLKYLFHKTIKIFLSAITGNPLQYCHAFPEFIRKSRKWKPDVIIGHNPGSLWLIYCLKFKLNKSVLFDAEDYHSGELSLGTKESQSIHSLEDRVLSKIDSMTTASPLIAQFYKKRFPSTPIETINNAFPINLQPKSPTHFNANQPITIVWFSQVVGLDRGIKEFLLGLSHCSSIPLRLDIVGKCSQKIEYILAKSIHSPLHEVNFLPLMDEAKLFEYISEHEIGLALETGTTLNRDICRTNKLFVYPMCGCFSLFSKTSAQVDFVKTYPEVGRLVSLNEPLDIKSAIEFVANNRTDVFQKRIKSWQLANETLNWEEESKKLLRFIHQHHNKPQGS